MPVLPSLSKEYPKLLESEVGIPNLVRMPPPITAVASVEVVEPMTTDVFQGRGVKKHSSFYTIPHFFLVVARNRVTHVTTTPNQTERITRQAGHNSHTEEKKESEEDTVTTEDTINRKRKRQKGYENIPQREREIQMKKPVGTHSDSWKCW
mgnify:CR=1 FL=1